MFALTYNGLTLNIVLVLILNSREKSWAWQSCHISLGVFVCLVLSWNRIYNLSCSGTYLLYFFVRIVNEKHHLQYTQTYIHTHTRYSDIIFPFDAYRNAYFIWYFENVWFRVGCDEVDLMKVNMCLCFFKALIPKINRMNCHLNIFVFQTIFAFTLHFPGIFRSIGMGYLNDGDGRYQVCEYFIASLFWNSATARGNRSVLGFFIGRISAMK